MIATPNKQQRIFGCALAVFSILTLFPIWCYLLYWVVTHLDAPPFVFGMFWTYAGLGVIVRVAAVIVEHAMGDINSGSSKNP